MLLRDMALRTFVAFGILVAAAALAAILFFSGKQLDLYYKDTYVVVSKTSLAVLAALALIVPLLAARIARRGPRHRGQASASLR